MAIIRIGVAKGHAVKMPSRLSAAPTNASRQRTGNDECITLDLLDWKMAGAGAGHPELLLPTARKPVATSSPSAGVSLDAYFSLKRALMDEPSFVSTVTL
jgi:hypothetical protein